MLCLIKHLFIQLLVLQIDLFRNYSYLILYRNYVANKILVSTGCLEVICLETNDVLKHWEEGVTSFLRFSHMKIKHYWIIWCLFYLNIISNSFYSYLPNQNLICWFTMLWSVSNIVIFKALWITLPLYYWFCRTMYFLRKYE